MAGLSSQQNTRQTFFFDHGRRQQRGPAGLAGAYLPSKNLYNAVKNLSPQSKSATGQRIAQPTARDKNTVSQFDLVKKRMKAAAYSNGQIDWHHLFKYYDKDNSGKIEFEEFKAAIRKSARITPSQLSDKDLRLLFEMVDTNSDGAVDYMLEFVPFLNDADHATSNAGSVASLQERRRSEVRQQKLMRGRDAGGIEQQQALAAQELFARMDVNKTGTLTFKDFERGLARQSLATPFARALKKEAWASDGRMPGQQNLGGGEDPLNLHAPPMTGDAGITEDDYEMLLADGDYEAAGLNPDSTVADIESLLAQEKLLGEQTKWWEDRLKTETAARKAFQAEMKAQDSQFSREVRDLQDLIAELRSEQAEAEEQAHFFVCEAKDFDNEAVVAGREMEMLKPKIAELRKSIFTSPRSVATSKGGTPTTAQRGMQSNGATPQQRSRASPAPTPGQTPRVLRGPGSQGSKSPVGEKRETEAAEGFDMNDMLGGGANPRRPSKGADVGAPEQALLPNDLDMDSMNFMNFK